jgi:hypothetical protein
MYTVLTVALFASSTAQARERPISDHENSVVIETFRLIEPRLHLEYQDMLSPNTSYTAGLTFGNENNLFRRLVNTTIEDQDNKLTVRNMGVNAAWTRHLKHFNRGWFFSANAAYDMYRGSVITEDLGSYQTIEVIPNLGYKIASEGGFTFSFDMGIGYRAVFGDDQIFKVPSVTGGAPAGMGPVATNATISMGWSF